MAVDAVIFDWGGTLTRWHDIDFQAESLALAQAVTGAAAGEADPTLWGERLHQAGETIWSRSRDHQISSTLADLFIEAGLDHDPDLLVAYYDFWVPHTWTDPEVAPVFRALRERGVKVGVLSNTIWPRAWHDGFFRRDGVLDLIDAAVYTSEIPWTKPSPRAFGAAVSALGVAEPSRCVYVGDRPYDDIYGAQRAGMRAILVPHSTIPKAQAGHREGIPDAVAHRLSEIPHLIADW